LDDVTEHWGVKVERVEVKDVRLPREMQRAMAAEAEATREARAKVGAFKILYKSILKYNIFLTNTFTDIPEYIEEIYTW
jgi:hypothetical protein